jgi:hypothetical protein
VHALLDPTLQARIISRRPLIYTTSAEGASQRPEHVRAASGIAWLGDALMIIQDDAAFLATLDANTGAIDALALPAGVDGARLFDVERGNKKHKLDMEACTTVMRDGKPMLLAIGSGSSSARESMVLLQHLQPELINASRLYAAMRDHPTFTTSELNLEGIVFLGDRVRVFQRSNGLAHKAHKHCATCDLDWPALRGFFDAPEVAPVPTIDNVRHYNLGSINNVPLTFTDATLLPSGDVLFVASAEGSPNAIDDGAVHGTALGIIDSDGNARMCHLLDEQGTLVTDKAEGIALSRTHDNHAYIVFDPDNHNVPAAIADVELRGF